MDSHTEIRNTSTTLPPYKTIDQGKISVWIPITVILILAILAACLVLCSHNIRRLCTKNVPNGSNHGDVHSVHMTLSSTDGRSVVPETPPPAYAALERQFSYVSQISQNSSQIEVPPDYEEVEVSAASSLDRRSVNNHPRGSAKLFTRSTSAFEDRSQAMGRPAELQFSCSVVDSPATVFEDPGECARTQEDEAGSEGGAKIHIPDIVKETPTMETQKIIEICDDGNPPDQKLGAVCGAAEEVFDISEELHSFREEMWSGSSSGQQDPRGMTEMNSRNC